MKILLFFFLSSFLKNLCFEDLGFLLSLLLSKFINLGMFCAYRFCHQYVSCFEESVLLWMCHAVYICSYFCELNTMYHCIIVTFIKQTINILTFLTEKTMLCLLLYYSGI